VLLLQLAEVVFPSFLGHSGFVLWQWSVFLSWFYLPDEVAIPGLYY